MKQPFTQVFKVLLKATTYYETKGSSKYDTFLEQQLSQIMTMLFKRYYWSPPLNYVLLRFLIVNLLLLRLTSQFGSGDAFSVCTCLLQLLRNPDLLSSKHFPAMRLTCLVFMVQMYRDEGPIVHHPFVSVFGRLMQVDSMKFR